MKKPAVIAVSTATLAVVVFTGGAGMAQGGDSTGTWPAGLPLPTNPGTLAVSYTHLTLPTICSV